MPKLTPEVLARLATLEALVSGDWQQKHAGYEPFEIIANLDGGYGDDGTQVRYDKVCVVDEDLPFAPALAAAELIPLMRNNLKLMLDLITAQSLELSATREQLEQLQIGLIACYDAAIPQAMVWIGLASEQAAYAAKILPDHLRRLNNLSEFIAAERDRYITVYPASEYQDEYGDVLWWNFPVCEPPHFSSPAASDWPGDRWTHFSRLPVVWNGDGLPKIEGHANG